MNCDKFELIRIHKTNVDYEEEYEIKMKKLE
jgi:hypothetical protein